MLSGAPATRQKSLIYVRSIVAPILIALRSLPVCKSVGERILDQISQEELAGTVGADQGRLALLSEIIGKVGRVDPAASDEELDLWWGSVEIDRLASGLTLAAIAKLSLSSHADTPNGPWIEKSDETGDEPTALTPAGREAIRRVDPADDAVQGTATVDNRLRAD